LVVFNSKIKRLQGKSKGKEFTGKAKNLIYNSNMGSKKPYRLIGHTADLGMEVRGKNISDLFVQAAWSFFDLMIEIQHIELKEKREISVEAPDREALMVAWLGELLFQFEAHNLVLGKFQIQSMTATSLQASAWGALFDPGKQRLKTAVKAVTYHQLRIWEKKGTWHARVIFDI
jgi:SHS2 domain-containing protein